jgi:hypothetical protein
MYGGLSIGGRRKKNIAELGSGGIDTVRLRVVKRGD